MTAEDGVLAWFAFLLLIRGRRATLPTSWLFPGSWSAILYSLGSPAEGGHHLQSAGPSHITQHPEHAPLTV